MSQSIVTKNIGRLVSEDIPEIFNKMVNEIEKSPFLSPIDYENIELADMTFDEFLDATRNMRKIFFYLDGNFCFVTNLMGKERGNILFAKHYEDIKMSKVFCYYDIYNWKTISAWKNYYELSLIEFENLQEFYDKMKPKKGRLYLKNGNFYEDFFTCESQNFYFS